MMRKFVISALILFGCATVAGAQDPFRSNYGEFYYLESGLVISQHVIEPTFRSASAWRGVANLSDHNIYRLREKQTRYLDVQFLTCGIDPFNPQPSTDFARDKVKNCFRAHVWENDDIPQWAKYMGAAIALGAASETGALGSEISVNFDLTSLNQLLSTENP